MAALLPEALREQLRDEAGRLLVEQLRLAFWNILFLALVLTAADFVFIGSGAPLLHVVNCALVATVLVALRVTRLPVVRRRPIPTALAIMAAVFVWLAVAGVVRHDVGTPLITTLLLIMSIGTAFAWGVGPQLAAIAMGGACTVWNVYTVNGGFGTFSHASILTVLVAMAASVWLAHRRDLLHVQLARRNLELQQAEGRRAGEERFAAIVQHSSELIVIEGSDAVARYVSPAVERVLGYTPQQFVGTNTFSYVHADDLARVRPRFTALIQEPGGIVTTEFRARHADGSWVHLEVLATNFLQHRQIQGLVVHARDISEHKRIQAELIRANAFLDSIVENIPDMVFVKDAKDLAFVLLNRAGENFLGYARADVIGKNDYDFFRKEEAEFFTASDRAVLHAKALLDIPEEPVETRGRDQRILHTKKIPILDGEGTPAYLLGISEDITDRKQAEQIRQRHERETTIVNEVLRALNAHLDVEAAFPDVCAGLRELAHCSAVSLNLFDDSHEWLTFVAADAPWAVGLSPDIRLGAAEIPAVPDALAGRPHVVGDLATELHFPVVQIVYELGLRSVVSLPLRVGNDVVGILNLFWQEVGGCHAAEIGVFTQVTNAVAIAVEKSRLFGQVKAGREQLAVLSRRLFEVQESERRHLARELHDEIGQYLTGVSLVLRQLEGGRRERADPHLGEVCKLVDGLIGRVRDLSLDLRPAMLDDLGLLPALLWLVARVSTQLTMRVDFQHSGINRRFPQPVETAAYRIVQEALTNTARHAGVSDARVQVSADHALLRVVIADDGAGFDVDEVLASGAAGGLTGMRERAALVGGRLNVESASGSGTRICAEFDALERDEQVR